MTNDEMIEVCDKLSNLMIKTTDFFVSEIDCTAIDRNDIFMSVISTMLINSAIINVKREHLKEWLDNFNHNSSVFIDNYLESRKEVH